MLTAIVLSTTLFTHSADAADLSGGKTVKKSLKNCDSITYAERCKDGKEREIGGETGKERVQDWIEGIDATVEADRRTFTVTLGREVIVYETKSPATAYSIVDVDGDRLGDLVIVLDDGSRWVAYQVDADDDDDR